MSNKSKLRSYTSDFKESAVQLALKGDKPVTAVARDLGMKPSTLHTWVAKYKDPTVKKSSSDSPSQEHLYDELKRLKRENARLKEEQAILKKAAAYFAKETL